MAVLKGIISSKGICEQYLTHLLKWLPSVYAYPAWPPLMLKLTFVFSFHVPFWCHESSVGSCFNPLYIPTFCTFLLVSILVPLTKLDDDDAPLPICKAREYVDFLGIKFPKWGYQLSVLSTLQVSSSCIIHFTMQLQAWNNPMISGPQIILCFIIQYSALGSIVLGSH